MNVDSIKGLFLLWVLVLVIELGWLFYIADRPFNANALTLVVTIIAVTFGIGAVGLNLFKGIKTK